MSVVLNQFLLKFNFKQDYNNIDLMVIIHI